MTETLEHKGYLGSVLFSAEDDLLHGRLLGIRDMVSYDGKSVRSIQKNFRDAVDDYLAFCKEEGREPNIPFNGSFNVRTTPDLHRRVNEALEAYIAKAS